MENLIRVLQDAGYYTFVGNYEGIYSDLDVSNFIDDVVNYSAGLWVSNISNFIYIDDMLRFLSIADNFYKRYFIRFLGLIEKERFINNKKLIESYSVFVSESFKKGAIKKIINKVESKQGHGLILI